MAITSEIRSDELLQEGGVGSVIFNDIGWKGYLRLLKLRGHRRSPRIVYLDGRVWLMSPSFTHEWRKERLGFFVMVVVEELRIHCTQSGSTTFRRKSKRGGVEGDKTFYLAHEARIRGKQKINLRSDPPPDLAIEAVHTDDAEPSVEVYRRFGVPEVWICDGLSLTILALNSRGKYETAERSISFPCLSVAEILEWVVKDPDASDTDWAIKLRSWVRETLRPRIQPETS